MAAYFLISFYLILFYEQLALAEIVPIHGWGSVRSLPSQTILWCCDWMTSSTTKLSVSEETHRADFRETEKKIVPQMKTTNTNSSTKALFRLGEVQQASDKGTVRVGYWKVCFHQKSSALSIKQPEYFQP